MEPTNDNGDGFTPIMNDSDGFDAREGTGRRAMLLLAGAFAFLLLVAIGLMKAYGTGMRGADEPPRILADTSPYKSAPENPGGEQTPNQDKSVYDLVSGDGLTEDVILAPIAEEPIAIEPKTDSATVIVKKPEAPVVRQPVASAPEIKAPVRSTALSDYVVQVASLRGQNEASQAWTTLNNKFGDIIPTSLFADIKRADLGDKGIYYRLRVSGFSSKDSASNFCSRLKARSQDCIVVLK